MCGYIGYRLKLDPYPPPKCEECRMRVPDGGSVLDFSKSSDGVGSVKKNKAWILRARFNFEKIVHG